MFCPKCRSEFRPGVTECANCELPLVESLSASAAAQTPEEMARVLAEKEVEALVVGQFVNLREVQRLLAAERLPSVIAGEAEEEVQPGVHPRLFLMVAQEDLERGKQILEANWKRGVATEGLMLAEAAAAASESASACPACGTAVPNTAAECPECGLYLGVAEEGAREGTSEE